MRIYLACALDVTFSPIYSEKFPFRLCGERRRKSASEHERMENLKFILCSERDGRRRLMKKDKENVICCCHKYHYCRAFDVVLKRDIEFRFSL
jgi:UV DNA damage repair endonuclease